MLLAGKAAELKAKLTQKGGKYLPTAAVLAEAEVPAGSGTNSLHAAGSLRSISLTHLSKGFIYFTRPFPITSKRSRDPFATRHN